MAISEFIIVRNLRNLCPCEFCAFIAQIKDCYREEPKGMHVKYWDVCTHWCAVCSGECERFHVEGGHEGKRQYLDWQACVKWNSSTEGTVGR